MSKQSGDLTYYELTTLLKNIADFPGASKTTIWKKTFGRNVGTGENAVFATLEKKGTIVTVAKAHGSGHRVFLPEDYQRFTKGERNLLKHTTIDLGDIEIEIIVRKKEKRNARL